MKGKTKLIDLLEEELREYELRQAERERWFNKFIEEEKIKHGQYEENEIGPICP